jgi:glycerol-3-phosphate dehydrogenase
LINYAEVVELSKDLEGFIDGATFVDMETGKEFTIQAKVVINATGAFCDSVRRMAASDVTPMIAPSQGIHLVFDRSFLPGDSAIMVPHTDDGRVMFAIPWHNHTLVGTTDTPIEEPTLEPKPHDEEIEFILSTAGKYLHKQPTRKDVLSVFVGIRPLVKAAGAQNTAALSRDHTIHIEQSGLLSIAGGKWTTYRRMAEDCVNQAAMLAKLPDKPCLTEHLSIHGFHKNAAKFESLEVYGSDAIAIQDAMRTDAAHGEQLHPALPYTVAEVLWAAQREMARTVEDVLARRTRALFLNARAAIDMAPRVAELIARELGEDANWQRQQIESFSELAKDYLVM